jgi:NarL family two-component system sensor histidine kinase YdfH
LAEYAQQVEMLTLEAERQRMARELHDTLAQGLAGLVMQLEALEASLERDNTEKAAQIAGQAKERARTTLADARRAIDDLRATDQTLLEAINLEISRFTTATGIPCQVEMPSEIHLKEQYGEHLVRCVSEGLANITRHARATKAWITITEENSRLQVQIRDNGQGFNTDETIPNGHYGLLGLRERVRLAQGELAIESSIGEGTTLTMILATNGDAISHPSRIIHHGVSS